MTTSTPAVTATATSAMAEALCSLREFLLPCWHWTQQNSLDHGQRFSVQKMTALPFPLSTNMCRHTTLFLQQQLALAGDSRWRVAGGWLANKDATVPLIRHYWLEADGFILDLTADQAGWDEVILTPDDDVRYTREASHCKQKLVSTLKGTTSQWRGEEQSMGIEGKSAFQALRARYPVARDTFNKDWQAAVGQTTTA
jgi:hypothetical protein